MSLFRAGCVASREADSLYSLSPSQLLTFSLDNAATDSHQPRFRRLEKSHPGFQPTRTAEAVRCAQLSWTRPSLAPAVAAACTVRYARSSSCREPADVCCAQHSRRWSPRSVPRVWQPPTDAASSVRRSPVRHLLRRRRCTWPPPGDGRVLSEATLSLPCTNNGVARGDDRDRQSGVNWIVPGEDLLARRTPSGRVGF